MERAEGVRAVVHRIEKHREDGEKDFGAQQKTVPVTAAVSIEPHDVTLRVDPIRLRRIGDGPRYVDIGKFTLFSRKLCKFKVRGQQLGW